MQFLFLLLLATTTTTTPPAYTESIVVSAIRADERTPVTKTDIPREEIEERYHGQDVPLLLRDAPSVNAYVESGAGGAGYSYITLRGVSVPAAEQRTADLDGQVERGAARQLASIHVPAERAWRHHRLLVRVCRADAHRPKERLDGNNDAFLQSCLVASHKVEDLQVRVGKLVGQ